MNTLKTTVLLAALTGLLIVIGKSLGGQSGMMIAFVMAVVMNFSSYWFSDKIVLAMHRAKPVDQGSAPELHRMVQELSVAAQIPMPRLYVIEDAAANAFATGRNPQHAVIAVTTGILDVLDRNELKGVLAHEMGHVMNRDILIGSIAATMAGAISMLANMAQWALMFGGGRRDDDERGGNSLALISTMIVAPMAAALIQMAISRSREFIADATGARLMLDPKPLASALRKLEAASRRGHLGASPATAHLFIVNPLRGGSLKSLFSTHPPTEERVRRLLAMDQTSLTLTV
ncbi:MAG: zinc metalloprotease HtpX [Elusimicrobiota bacterium]